MAAATIPEQSWKTKKNNKNVVKKFRSNLKSTLKYILPNDGRDDFRNNSFTFFTNSGVRRPLWAKRVTALKRRMRGILEGVFILRDFIFEFGEENRGH